MTVSFIAKSRVVAVGRIFFAIGMLGIGFQHFFFRKILPLVAPIWPAWIPGRPFWAYLVGTILVLGGISILSGFKARAAAILLSGLFLLSFVLLHVPANLIAGVKSLGGWALAIKAFSLAGCALVVAGTSPATQAGNSRSSSTGLRDKLIRLGMYPFAIGIIAFGVCHFLYTPYVATLVPAWIPGHVFWTYFAGTALIASGLGMIVGVKARLAATLLGAMILTWILILHIPRAVADPYGDVGNEWTSTLEALAKTGVAFILGETLGGSKAEADSGKS
jgi:uncharacterized membrane protein YphA (DoxX/SURF4 family)